MQKEKAVWITGASSGIGEALSREFVEQGKIVIGTSRRIEQLDLLKSSLGEAGGRFHVFQLDIMDLNGIISFVEMISRDFQIDTLINNAGVTSFKKAADDTYEEIQSIILTNLLGSIFAIKALLPGMLERNSGRIINILSVVAKKIFLNSSAYSASKTGLLAYTNVLREELRNSDIRVINVLPGATRTKIWNEKVIDKYSHRMMKPEEISRLIYLLHEQNSVLVPEEIVLKPIQGDL